MDREIKFRAWDMGKMHHFTLFNLMGAVYWPDKDASIMQFTGLRDCNGKEIYEGDVVRVTTKWPPDKLSQTSINTSVIGWGEYDDGDLIWGLECWLVGYSYHRRPLCCVLRERFDYKKREVCTVEIIGNVHENPGLVEEIEDEDK